MTASAYPLAWPAHVPRTPSAERKRAAFSKKVEKRFSYSNNIYMQSERLTVADARKRLVDELDKMRDSEGRYASGFVISSMLALRADGLPRSGEREPDDPGVAVYFYLGGKHFCLPCDRWDRVADNLAAIAGHIHATRAIERYGVGSVEQAFSGFAAIEAPSWWRDLGLKSRPATLAEAEAAWRRFIKEHHPDRGGDVHLAARANQAIADARRDFGQ